MNCASSVAGCYCQSAGFFERAASFRFYTRKSESARFRKSFPQFFTDPDLINHSAVAFNNSILTLQKKENLSKILISRIHTKTSLTGVQLNKIKSINCDTINREVDDGYYKIKKFKHTVPACVYFSSWQRYISNTEKPCP